MKSQILKLAKKPFVRNVVTVATGTAAAQAIGVAFSPLITRLYGPEAFGLLGTFMALVAVLTPIAALCYPIAIVLPKKDEDAKALAKLSIYISLGIALLVTFLLLIGGDWLLALVGAEAISTFKFLIPLNLLFATLLQITQQWLIRKKQFKVKAKVAVAHAAIISSVKTGIGFFYPLAAVLIVMSSLGHIIHTGMLFLGLTKTKKLPTNKLGDKKESLKETAKRYRDFPLYQTPQLFLNAISNSMPVLVLASVFGPASAGFYALGKKVLKMPSMLIGQSVGTVFMPSIAEAHQNKKSITGLLVKATLSLAAAGFLPFLTIVLFGPSLFGFAFGTEWTIAGEYARWLSIWLFFAFINPPSVKTMIVLRRQHLSAILNFASVIARFFALLLGSFVMESQVGAVAYYSLVGAAHNIIFVLVAFYKSKQLS